MQFLKRNGRKGWLQLALVGLITVLIMAVITIDRQGQSPAYAQSTPAPGTPGNPGSQTTGDTGTISGDTSGGSSESEEALEPAAYSQVQRLRGEWSLTHADLAAMGLNQAQAEAVLGQVKAWYTANATALEQRDQAVREARAALGDAYRQISIGPEDQSLIRSVPTLQSNLTTATTARQQLTDAALPGIETRLGGEQRTIWQAARANANAPSALRYASDLGGEQIEAHRQQQLRYNRELNTPAPGSALGTTPGSLGRVPGVGGSLNVSQVQQTALAKENQRLFTPGVLVAEQRVLPVPEELLQDELVMGELDDERNPNGGGL